MNAARLALSSSGYPHRGISSVHDIIRRYDLRSMIAACAFAAACVAGAGSSSAGTIIWGDATTISGDGDVSTKGNLVYAYNIGGAGVQTTTVNGVRFDPFVWPKLITNAVSNANVSIREIGGSLNVYDTLGSASGSYASLSSSYKTLLNSGGSATTYAYLEVTLNGLTNGQDYALQWWSSNGSNALGDDGQSLATTIAATIFGSTPQVTLSSNVSNTAGGLGQYVVGTFTASGTDQVFLLTGPSVDQAPLINGFQVRAVPESSTYAMALAGIACGGFSMWRRRNRA